MTDSPEDKRLSRGRQKAQASFPVAGNKLDLPGDYQATLADLKQAFPEMNGFSPRNLKYMRKFAQQWPEREIVQRVAAQIPWRSNQLLLDKLDNEEKRHWYAVQQTHHVMQKNALHDV